MSDDKLLIKSQFLLLWRANDHQLTIIRWRAVLSRASFCFMTSQRWWTDELLAIIIRCRAVWSWSSFWLITSQRPWDNKLLIKSQFLFLSRANDHKLIIIRWRAVWSRASFCFSKSQRWWTNKLLAIIIRSRAVWSWASFWLITSQRSRANNYQMTSSLIKSNILFYDELTIMSLIVDSWSNDSSSDNYWLFIKWNLAPS